MTQGHVTCNDDVFMLTTLLTIATPCGSHDTLLVIHICQNMLIINYVNVHVFIYVTSRSITIL